MKTNKLELIYNSTISLIKQLGVEQVSVSKIAKEAGIGKGSIYYYVESKNDIIDGIAIRTVQRIAQEYKLRVSQHNIDVFEKMKLLFSVTSNATFSDGSINDMHILFIQPDMYLHQRINSAFMKYLVPILENIIIEGTNIGILQSDNPKKAAELIIMAMLMVFDGELLPTQERVDTIERMDYLAGIIEKNLAIPTGSLGFIRKIY